MKDDRVIRPTHTLLFPYAQIVCGKVFEMPLEAIFECERLTDPEVGEYLDIRVIDLTGTDGTGRLFNMMQLIEAEDEITQCLMVCLLNNEAQWDKTYEWWCKDKPD